MRTGLVLPYMLGLNVISLSISMPLLFFFLLDFNKKKKNWGEDAEFFFFFDSFSDIACVFFLISQFIVH
jgi:hypothetical protein